jgi:hypothetical protein
LSPDEKDNQIKNEVEKRLDDLFGDEEESPYPGKAEISSESEEISGYDDTIEQYDFEENADTMVLPDGQPSQDDEEFEDTQGFEEKQEFADTQEIEPRIIEEDENYTPAEEQEEPASGGPSNLKKLKAIILSIDWEINDETMTSLKDQVELLKEELREDKVVVMFLRLLGSVGKYIKNNKANAHPGSIKLLNSVYENLENVILEDKLAENERERLLLGEVEAFKKLKDDIATRKAKIKKKKDTKEETKIEKVPEEILESQDEEEEPPEPDEISTVQDQLSPHEAFSFAMEEIKSIIKAEFKALRAELKLWRKTQ